MQFICMYMRQYAICAWKTNQKKKGVIEHYTKFLLHQILENVIYAAVYVGTLVT